MIQPLFRSTLPVAVVEAGVGALAVVFFVAAPATPFRVELAVPFLAVEAADLAAAVRFTTVPVLASLVSLLALIRRAVRVAGREGGARAGARLVLAGAVVPLELELVLDAAVTFLEVAARVALAFSTILERMFVATAVRAPIPLRGEAGRAICDFAGDAGRGGITIRELDEVGDKICVGRTWAASVG